MSEHLVVAPTAAHQPPAPQPPGLIGGGIAASSPPAPSEGRVIKAVRFTAYPNFVVVWPVIVLGLLFSLLHSVGPNEYPERITSTAWLFSLFAVMIALGFDLDSSETAFIVMTLVLILLVLQLVAFEWQFPVFSWIAANLGMLEVRVSPNMMLVVSILLGVPYLLMLFFSRINNHWTVVPGKLIRTTFGKNEEEIPINSTKTVNYHFYDMLMRWLCFGAGHLVVTTDKGERKIGHVLWAKRRDRDIEPFETMPVSAPAKQVS